MSGFKKCGIFPLNPSEIDDRQTAPSKAVHYQTATESDKNRMQVMSQWIQIVHSSLLKKRLSVGRGTCTRRGMVLMILGTLLGWKSTIQLKLVLFAQGHRHPRKVQVMCQNLEWWCVGRDSHSTATTYRSKKLHVCITEDEVLEEKKGRNVRKLNRKRRRKQRNWRECRKRNRNNC